MRSIFIRIALAVAVAKSGDLPEAQFIGAGKQRAGAPFDVSATIGDDVKRALLGDLVVWATGPEAKRVAQASGAEATGHEFLLKFTDDEKYRENKERWGKGFQAWTDAASNAGFLIRYLNDASTVLPVAGNAVRGVQVASILFRGDSKLGAREAIERVKQVERNCPRYRNWLGLARQYANVEFDGPDNMSPSGDYVDWGLRYTVSVPSWRDFTFVVRIRDRAPGKNLEHVALVTDYYSKSPRWSAFVGFDAYIPIMEGDKFLGLLFVTTFLCDTDSPLFIVLENHGNLRYLAEMGQ